MKRESNHLQTKTIIIELQIVSPDQEFFHIKIDDTQKQMEFWETNKNGEPISPKNVTKDVPYKWIKEIEGFHLLIIEVFLENNELAIDVWVINTEFESITHNTFDTIKELIEFEFLQGWKFISVSWNEKHELITS